MPEETCKEVGRQKASREIQTGHLNPNGGYALQYEEGNDCHYIECLCERDIKNTANASSEGMKICSTNVVRVHIMDQRHTFLRQRSNSKQRMQEVN